MYWLAAEEDIRRFGPDMVDQLHKKIDIMNAHGNEYDRVFTSLN